MIDHTLAECFKVISFLLADEPEYEDLWMPALKSIFGMKKEDAELLIFEISCRLADESTYEEEIQPYLESMIRWVRLHDFVTSPIVESQPSVEKKPQLRIIQGGKK